MEDINARFRAAWEVFARTCARAVAPEATFRAWFAHDRISQCGIDRVAGELTFKHKVLGSTWQHLVPEGQGSRTASVGRGRPSITGLLTAAAITAATLLAGSQGSERPNPTVPTPAAPERTGPYNKEELAVYREAVQRVDDFEAKNQPILAAGNATRQAKEFYQDSLRMWQSSYEQLQSYEREGIKIARRPVVISTKAKSIKSFQDDAAEVVLTRCTDQSNLRMTRAGVLLPPVHDEPVIQQVVVYRYENRTWRIGSFKTTDRPCAG